jgi:hypothetical protein
MNGELLFILYYSGIPLLLGIVMYWYLKEEYVSQESSVDQ